MGGHGKAEKARPFPTGLWMMCNTLFVMLWGGKVGRHMTTLLWCFHLFEFQRGVQSVFVLFVIFYVSCLCKEKSPRLLRNEVSDMFLSFQGLFCCLNKLILFFQKLLSTLITLLREEVKP